MFNAEAIAIYISSLLTALFGLVIYCNELSVYEQAIISEQVSSVYFTGYLIEFGWFWWDRDT